MKIGFKLEPYLVKSNNVYTPTKWNMLGMQAKNVLFLQTSLGKGIVGSESCWKNWGNHESENVQAVQNDFVSFTLKYENKYIMEA